MANFTTPVAEALQVCQFGLESVQGTAVPATSRFHSLVWDVDPKVPIFPVTQAGNLFDVDTVAGKQWSEGSGKGAFSVQDFIYALACGLSIPSFSTVGTLTKQALFTPNSLAANAIKTLTVEKGDAAAGLANKYAFGYFTDIEAKLTPDKLPELTVKSMGQGLATGVTLTGGTTSLGNTVVSPTQIDVYLATSSGALAANQCDPLDVTFKMSKTIGNVFALKSSDPSFSDIVNTRPALSVDLVMKKGAFTNTLLAALEASTLYFIQIVARGSLIETVTSVDYYNQVSITMPVRFSNPGEGSAQDAHTASFTATAQHDEGYGGAIQIACQSLLSAL